MSREKKAQDRQAYIIFGGLGVLIAVVLLFKFATAKEKVNKHTNCPKQIIRESVFILDRSSTIAEQTKNEIQARIRKLINEKVHEGERITFYEVNDRAYTELKPLIINKEGLDFCKPKLDVNDLVENQSLATKRYESKIKTLLEMEHLKNRGTLSSSPIAQVIFDVSLSQHMNNRFISFYLFSDLMENSKEVSLYGCHDGKTAVSQYVSSRTGRAQRPSFKNISHFEIHRIPTKNSSQVISCRNHFWNWFFGDIQKSEEVTETLNPNDLFKDLPG